MRRMAASFLFLILPLGSCGMGSMGTVDALGGTHMSGTVLSVDGDATNLSKVTVEAPDLGVSAPCDAEGRFDLGDVPATRMRMHVRTPGRAVTETWVDLADCREMDVRIVVEDSRIVRAYLEHCGAHHGAQVWAEMHGATHDGVGVAMDHGGMHGADDMHAGGMHRDGDMMGDGGMMGGQGARGMGTATNPCGDLGMHQDAAGRMGFALAIDGLDPDAAIEVFLADGDGTRLSLGIYSVDAQGRLLADWDATDGLPFGAQHVRDLAGMTLELVDVATGTVLLSGTLPDLGELGPDCDDTDAP